MIRSDLLGISLFLSNHKQNLTHWENLKYFMKVGYLEDVKVFNGD